MRSTLITLLALLFLASPLFAAERAGIDLPDSITVDGKRLTLNGIGLRTKLMFKVYVAGLYLEQTSSDANQVITSDQVRRVEMVMMRDLEKAKITEAVVAGFEKNNADQMPALQSRLKRFNAGIADLEEGDRLTITYSPEKGTNLESRRGKTLTIEGKDFGDALFSVWLGAHPVDDDLKQEMLGISD